MLMLLIERICICICISNSITISSLKLQTLMRSDYCHDQSIAVIVSVQSLIPPSCLRSLHRGKGVGVLTGAHEITGLTRSQPGAPWAKSHDASAWWWPTCETRRRAASAAGRSVAWKTARHQPGRVLRTGDVAVLIRGHVNVQKKKPGTLHGVNPVEEREGRAVGLVC